jgi:signal transduction histidine kinase
MRLAPAVIAVPILLVLLTWVSLRALNTDAEYFDNALNTLDRAAMAQSALHRDVLAARAGLLRNYDPLVRHANALRGAAQALRDNPALNGDAAPAIARLATSIDQQEAIVEQVKSNNALLRNSLAYFVRFSLRLGSGGSEKQAPAASALAIAMLHLTLDTSSIATREVLDRLAVLATLTPAEGDAEADALLAHGRLLANLLPATDRLLRSMRAVPIQQEMQVVRSMILARQLASRAAARQSRLLLYAISLLLVALLVHLGLRLRERVRALHRRAAFEHLIAGISTRFINARQDEIDHQVTRALVEIAERVGADRGYIVMRGAAAARWQWSRDPGAYPSGWPDQALVLATQLGATATGIIHIADVDGMPAGWGKNALVAAGVRSWACVAKLDGGVVSAVLGFDALRAPFASPSGELGLLRMALDTVGNAVKRQALEHERAQLEQDLQHARRMETIGALASGIAHNFNNILGAILGHAEMAETRLAADSRATHNVGEIRRAGERARDLVDQILAFGRRPRTQRTPVRVRQLVAETASLVHASLPTRVGLVVHEVPDDAMVAGEYSQLQQVVLNLVNNAAQAMDGVGQVELEAELHDIAAPRTLSHGELTPGRYVCIAVSDTGRGIDDATLGRIFEPFFTTRLAGNGLGLATVREIVLEHCGAMQVRSTVGVGSRFEAWLPCIATAVTQAEVGASDAAFGHGEAVMLVEADRAQLLRGEELLAALGYEPVGFADPADALAACQAAPTRFDALLVGHLTAAAAAPELATDLRKAAPHLPVLLARGSADGSRAEALAAAGINEVVRWPLVSAELATALHRCLHTTAPPTRMNVPTVPCE